MADIRVPRIVITPGEPAGIGPDVALQIAQQEWPAELIVVGDPDLLAARAAQLQLPLTLSPVDFKQDAVPHVKSHLKILPVTLSEPCAPGQLNASNAHYVLSCLETATDLCLNKTAAALVTGPVQKSIINEAGFHFTGHTEFLAERCKTTASLMLFVVDTLKVALVTTHIPLVDVSKTLTREKLRATLLLLQTELQKKFHLPQPRILVAGLNPHAGEMGHMGREEIEIMQPVIEALRKEGLLLEGPLPADTIFTPHHLKNADAILAMYHDQALPVIKYMGFDRAVNVTLGLPIIRTSVDHGTALDLAGTGYADAGSMRAALQLAIQLATPV